MATTSTLGVQDIINLAQALADTATIADSVKGVPTITQLPQLIKAFSVVKEFGAINYAAILPEYEDLDDGEIAQVAAAFNSHLNIKEATLQASVEAGFAVILQASQLVQAGTQIVKAAKDLFAKLSKKAA